MERPDVRTGFQYPEASIVHLSATDASTPRWRVPARAARASARTAKNCAAALRGTPHKAAKNSVKTMIFDFMTEKLSMKLIL